MVQLDTEKQKVRKITFKNVKNYLSSKFFKVILDGFQRCVSTNLCTHLRAKIAREEGLIIIYQLAFHQRIPWIISKRKIWIKGNKLVVESISDK